MRCACIDIGSNTTRLLVADVADGRIVPIAEQRAFTRLGRACGAGDALRVAALEPLAGVVAAQAAEARALGAEALRVVATAAVRRAANALDACHALSAAAGAPVELLSERDEARLAFAGAIRGRAGGDERIAVLDVGGGSAQLVVGTGASGAAWSVSLPLGSGDLAAAHLRSDPPSAEQVSAVRAVAARALDGLDVPCVERALAVGGSATSLGRLAGPRLDRAGLRRALAVLLAAPSARVAQETGIAPERVRLLPAGIVVLEAFAGLVGQFEIVRAGLREGVVHELAEPR